MSKEELGEVVSEEKEKKEGGEKESFQEELSSEESLSAPKKIKKSRKCYLHTGWMLIVFWLIFSVLYYFFAFDLANIKYYDINNQEVIDIFSRFAPWVGTVLGFLSLVGGSIVFLILKKTKSLTKTKFVFPILALLMNLPWYLIARQLVYFEEKYTDIAKALIYYVGEPLLSTTKVIWWLILVWLLVFLAIKIVKKNNLKKTSMVAGLLVIPFVLTGCVGTINQWACQFFDDQDHCYQNAAIQDGDPGACEKIKGGDFASAGSNPPRDKCYLKIAENTGDLSVCDNIEGGAYSYTREECILGTAVKHKNPDGCIELEGEARNNCASRVGPYVYPGSIIDMDEQIEFLKKELENDPGEDLQKQLADLQKRRLEYLDIMNENNKGEDESISDPRNKQVAKDLASGKNDEETKDSLVALNDSLRNKGEKLSDKEYKALRDMLAFKNDPKNDIENMDPTEIVKLRWNEKVGNAVDYLKFWNSNPTEKEKKYDQQLLFYQRMLERQKAIEKGLSQKQQDFERESGRVLDYVKDELYNTAMDEAKKAAFGELMDLVDSPASAPVTA